MNSLSKNIKGQRLSHKMTQEELAEKLSVTRQTVSCWENGKSEPDLDTIIKLSELFGIEVNNFINGETSPLKKSHNRKSHRIIIPLVFILLLSFVVFHGASETDDASLYNVTSNPKDYVLHIDRIENFHFQLFYNGEKISISEKSLGDSEYITITDYSFDDEKIIIKGKTKPIYQDKTSGSIIIPSVYRETYFYTTEEFVNFISNYDESIVRGDFGENTASGITITKDSPFESEYLYYAVPFSYDIRKDGTVEFEFVFEKTNNEYNKKSLAEYISEGFSPLIHLKCITLEWEYSEPHGDVNNKIN